MKNIKQSKNSERSLTGYAVAVTILLGSVLVFFGLYAPYVNSKTFVISFGVVISLLIALWAYPIQKAKTALGTPIFWGVSAYMLALVIVSFTSIDPTLSWLGMPVRATSTFLLLVLGIFAMTIGGALSKEQVQRYVFLPISISGALIAVSVYAEKWGWKFLASASDGGVLGNTSYTGTYLAISLFITLYLCLVSHGKKKAALGFLALVTLLNPVFVNFSFSPQNGIFDLVGDARGAAVSVAIGLLIGVFVWLATSARRTSKLVGKSALAGAGVLSVVMIMQLLSSSSALHNWFVEKASGTRFIYWDVAMKGFYDSPIVGTGPETYVYTYQTHFNSDMYLAKNNMEVWADKPHNIYLEVLSTSGIIGAIGYLVLLLTLFYSTYRGYKRHGDRLYVVAMYSLLTAYLVNNLLIFDTPTSFLLLFVIAGAAISYSKKTEDVTMSFKNSSQQVIQAVIGLGMVALVSVIIFPQITKMKREYVDLNIPFNEKDKWYKKTEDVSPYGSAINLSQRLGQLYEDQLVENIQSILVESQQNKDIVIKVIDSAVEMQLELFEKYPKNAQGLLNIGKIESIKMAIQNKADEKSLAIMKESASETIRIAPTNPVGHWLLGQVYTYENKFDEAFAEFEKARAINPAVAESHNNMIRLATFIKDQKKVDFYTERAIKESEDFKNAGGVK